MLPSQPQNSFVQEIWVIKKATALLLYQLSTRCIKQVLGHNSPGKEGDGGFTHTASHQSSGDNPASRAARLPARPGGDRGLCGLRGRGAREGQRLQLPGLSSHWTPLAMDPWAVVLQGHYH